MALGQDYLGSTYPGEGKSATTSPGTTLVTVNNTGVTGAVDSDGLSNVSNKGLVSYGGLNDVNNQGLVGTSEPGSQPVSFSGSIANTSTVSGQPSIVVYFSATIANTSTVTGSLTASPQFSGTIANTSTVTGSLDGVPSFSGTINNTSTVTGSLTAQSLFSATIANTSTVAGTLSSPIPFSGTIANTSTVAGSLTAPTFFSATIANTSTVSGSLSVQTFFNGTIANTSTVSGLLHAPTDIWGSPTYGGVILANSPLAFWTLQEASGATAASDSSGNGHTGTPTSGVTFGAWNPLAGQPTATGASFSGSGTAVNTLYNPSGLTGFSAAFIINAQGNAQTYTRLLANDYTASDQKGFDIYVNGSSNLQVTAYFGNGSSFGGIATASTIPLTGTHLLVVTWDGSTVRAYIDGVQDTNTASFTGPIAAGSYNVMLAANPNGGSPSLPFDGELAGIALFGTALSSSTVTSLYSALTSTSLSPAQSNSTSTVSGNLTGIPEFFGSIANTSTVAGALTAKTLFSATIANTSTVAGQPSVAALLSGNIANTSQSIGSLTASPKLSGTVPNISTVTGTISSPVLFSGTINNTSVVTGTLSIDSVISALAGFQLFSVAEIARYQPMLYPSTSYYTEQVYQTLPESLQEQDAANGYTLWYFIQSLVSGLDQLSNLFFDSIGAGTAVFPVNPGNVAFTPAQLKSNLTFNALNFTVFNTDATWNQINTSNPFPVEIEGERILIPAGTYNWEATEVTFTNVQRGWDSTVPAAHNASSGANMEFDLLHYFGAPGWSQVLDINRCPDYALPWLGQFVGVDLTKTPNLNYEQSVQKILSRPGFSRGTVPALQNAIAAVINNSLAGSANPINASQVICLENTSPIGYNNTATLFAAITGTGSTTLQLIGVGPSWFNAAANSPLIITIGSENIKIPQGVYSFANGPVSISIPSGNRGYGGTTAATHAAGASVTVQTSPSMYQYNQYGITLLIPATYFNIFTYNSLLAAAGGAGTTYATLDSFISGLGPTDEYANVQSTTVPSSSNSFASYVYSQRPAGVEVFVGAY